MALRSLTLPPPSVHIDGEGATGPEVGQYTALTLSSAGTEYISYFDGTQGDLNLAARVSTGLPQGRLRARQHYSHKVGLDRVSRPFAVLTKPSD